MVQNIIKFLVNGFAVYSTAYLLSGVSLTSFYVALLVALVLTILNLLVRPVLLVLSLPINILTLGLFTFVINALIVIIATKIVPGFEVNSFWDALLFSIVLAIISSVLNWIIG